MRCSGSNGADSLDVLAGKERLLSQDGVDLELAYGFRVLLVCSLIVARHFDSMGCKGIKGLRAFAPRVSFDAAVPATF